MVSTFRLRGDGKVFAPVVREEGGRWQVRLSESGAPAEASSVGTGALSVVDDGRSFEVRILSAENGVSVWLAGQLFVIPLEEAGSTPSRRAAASGRAEVKAPMPGKVVKLLVASGDRVEEGQPVMLFEAMKMQNELKSPLAGEVVLSTQEGQAVESRGLLFTVRGAHS